MAWLAWGPDRPTRRVAAADIAETLLLVATFAVVPPVLDLGVYFDAWHSLRHIARLLLIADPTRGLVASDRLLAAFWEFQKGRTRPCLRPKARGRSATPPGDGRAAAMRLIRI